MSDSDLPSIIYVEGHGFVWVDSLIDAVDEMDDLGDCDE